VPADSLARHFSSDLPSAVKPEGFGSFGGAWLNAVEGQQFEEFRLLGGSAQMLGDFDSMVIEAPCHSQQWFGAARKLCAGFNNFTEDFTGPALMAAVGVVSPSTACVHPG